MTELETIDQQLVKLVESQRDYFNRQLSDPEPNVVALEETITSFMRSLDKMGGLDKEREWNTALESLEKRFPAIPKSLSDSGFKALYKALLHDFLSQLIDQLQKQGSQIAFAGAVPDPETLRRLKEDVDKNNQRLQETSLAQQQWKGKWKRVFEEQLRVQRLKALGIIIAQEAVLKQNEQYKEIVANPLPFAVELVRKVKTNSNKPPNDKKTASELSQDIIDRLHNQGCYPHLPKGVHPELKVFVRSVSA